MKTDNSKDTTEIIAVRTLSDLFARQCGRRPRIMIAEPKSIATNGDSKMMASIYADLGFDVDLPPPFENGMDIVKQSIESDVHILCIIMNAGYDWATVFTADFFKYSKSAFKIVLSADLTAEACSFLLKNGTTAIFPRHKTPIAVAKEMLTYLLEN